MNRLLFIQTAFLGDVILATAAIAEARRLFPDAQIDVLVRKGNESLLANNPKINTVYTLDKKAGKWREMKRLIKAFQDNQYDIIFNFHRFGSSGYIAVRSKAKKVYGFDKNPFSLLYSKKFVHSIGNGTHEVARNMQLLEEFGANKNVRPELFPSEQDFAKVKPLQKESYYCLAPASVWFTKQMPEHKWVELINQLDGKVYLLGGKTDIPFCSSILNEVRNERVINLAGQLNLLQSAALMQGAKRNYVNDSGPLHISSAMNAPITAFFCSTILDFGFGPLSEDQQVLEVVNLDCKPCGLHGHRKCPKGHFKCGEIPFESLKK